VRGLAQFQLLQFQPPGDEPLWPVAVLLFDPSTGTLHIRGRESYASIAAPEDAEVLDLTVKQLQADAEEQDGGAILATLEDRLSNSVRITERIALPVLDFRLTLDHLSAAFIP
jgi:hypothetical protein